MTAIGIDLGTTNSCIAHDKNGKVEVIPYSGDSRTLPSYIGFWKDEILFGDVAKKRLSKNVENTIYDVKRMIGRNFSDELVQKYIDRWDFKVIKAGDKIKVSINQTKDQKEAKFYSPEELSALLIKELKNRAEQALDKEVTKAVITVPTYFNDSQRQATIDAGKLAGFEEIKLLNEPTAAAIAYSFENVSDQEKTIFVFDFGGGTFDVSLIKFQNKEIQVVAIDGDIELGGNDIDDILYNHIAQMHNLDFNTKSSRSRKCRLKAMCEDAKKQLSSSEDAIIELIQFDETDQDLTITREQFNRLNEKVFKDTKDIVERCLKNANMDISNIDDIVMVGGSSKIRKIGDLLREYFGKQLKYSINQDEAVAIGAAMFASQWGKESAFKDMKFFDISPFSLGVETAGGKMNTIIPRFSKLPAKDTKTFCTSEDYQEVVKVNVYSGENKFIKDNHYLGTLKVSGFKIGPARSVKIMETFELDKNGILTVSVLDPSRGKSKHLTINLDKGRFSEEELNQKMSMLEKEYSQSKEAVKFKKLKNDCMDLCHHPKLKGSIPDDCEKMLAWLKDLKYNQQNITYLEDKAKEFQYHLSRI